MLGPYPLIYYNIKKLKNLEIATKIHSRGFFKTFIAERKIWDNFLCIR